MTVYLHCKLAQIATVGKLQVLMVAEVKLELKERGHLQELVAEKGKGGGDIATQLSESNAVCCLVGGGNEVGDSLCLAEVELAVDESPSGKLARLCLATARIDEQAQDM